MPRKAQLEDAEKEFRALLIGEKANFKQEIHDSLNKKLEQIIDVEVLVDFTIPQNLSERDFVSRVNIDIADGLRTTKPVYQGHGVQRTLLLALYETLAREKAKNVDENNPEELILLIEEPEIYMHPQMTRKMRDLLLDIAQQTQTNAQVVCTTHSPVFLDLADRHDGIVILRDNKDGSGTEVVQRYENIFEEKEERNRLRMMLNFDAAVNEIFFAECVCLVEGDTEVAAIEAYAEKLIEEGKISKKKYLLARRDVTIVNCRGKWTIPAFQRVLNAFNISYSVVHDLDDKDEEEGANGAIAELAENTPYTFSINFEQDIFGKKLSGNKPWKVTNWINNKSEKIQNEGKLKEFFLFMLGKESLDELKAEKAED